MQNGYRLPAHRRQPADRGRRAGGLDAQTDIDGFNLTRLVAHESLRDFVDLVVPELQSRGIYKEDYAPGTLREAVRRGRRAAAGLASGRQPPARPRRLKPAGGRTRT